MRAWFLPLLLSVLLVSGIALLLVNAPALGMKQVGFSLVGAFVFLLFSQLPIDKIFLHQWRWWLSGVVLLILPLILQTTVRGTARWIFIGPLSIQPSQLAFLLIAISLILFRISLRQQTWRSTISSLIAIAIPALLIALAPDLGTALFFSIMMMLIVFITDVPWKHVVVTLIVGSAFAVLSWNTLLYPYQKTRITSFLNPSQASAAATYNVRQSLIAIGSGGLLGAGVGEGTQSKLRFLPERHTDFIFASIAEQVGFIGSITIVSLYLALGIFCIVAATSLSTATGQIFVTYVGLLVLVQAGINIGTNLGLLPVTGMTLPLVSAGGTSLIVYCALFGIAQFFIKQPRKTTSLHLE